MARLITTVLIAVAASAVDYRHGISYIEPLKYAADFEHFHYVNPDAPKGDTLRVPERVALGLAQLSGQ